VRFIQLAKALDKLGYQMIWVKHRGVVGATRKVRGDNLTSSQSPFHPTQQPPKEVRERVNAGNNERSI
jgi:hypothetical protein